MKNSFSFPMRKFLFFSLGLCVAMAAGFLATRVFPRNLWPTVIVADIWCVAIAGLLLLLSDPTAYNRQDGLDWNRESSGEHDAPGSMFREVSSQVEELQSQPDPVEFNLLTSIKEILQTLRPQAREKGMEIICEVQPDVPELVVGDVSRLLQVLGIMVGNTIKLKDRGEVIVRVERQSHGQGDCVLHFTVQKMRFANPEGKQRMMTQDISHAHVSATRPFREALPDMTKVLQQMDIVQGPTWEEFELLQVGKTRGRVWVELEGERASCFHFTALYGIPASVAVIQPAQDTAKKSLPARDVDEDDRAA